MSRIDGSAGAQQMQPLDFDLEIPESLKAAISTDNTFGTGKADDSQNKELARTLGLIAATVTSADLATLMASLRTKTEHVSLKTSTENVKAIKVKYQIKARNGTDDQKKWHPDTVGYEHGSHGDECYPALHESAAAF